MTKAIVSLSGGRDSSTCLGLAVERYGECNVYAVGFEYGSKHPQELKAGQKIADYYNVPYQIIKIDPSIFEGSTSTLLKSSGRNIQLGKTYEEILKEKAGKVDTYVPARNTLFSAYVLAKAESISQEYGNCEVVILLGQHADDSGYYVDENGNEHLDDSKAAYPDCSVNFINAFAKVAEISSVGKVKYWSPFAKMRKHQVIELGTSLKKPVPYSTCISCYNPVKKGDYWYECGKCATCLDVKSAVEKAGLIYQPGKVRI